MRTIELSSKNIGFVIGRLKQFFFNYKYGFTTHHNFDCGYKRIKPYSFIQKHETVDKIEIDYELENKKPYIRIVFQEGVSATVLRCGSRLIFKGNEIITQEKWFGEQEHYIYTVYRLCKLTENDLINITRRRQFEKEMNDDDHILINDEIALLTGERW